MQYLFIFINKTKEIIAIIISLIHKIQVIIIYNFMNINIKVLKTITFLHTCPPIFFKLNVNSTTFYPYV